MNKPQSPANPMARVFSLRDFRLLFIGAVISLLGDQFALIATPWLVLRVTNDPLALGTVLALEGLPRAAFMLFGGAIADHLSPRLVMLIANITRFFLTAIMALLIFTGTVQLWMIYVFGLLFGIVAGFAMPAENSIVPMLVAEQDLQAGNSLIMGATQLAGFLGPTLAGVLIGWFSDSNAGIVFAFAFDALTFVVSGITLQLIRIRQPAAPEQVAKENVWASIRAGIAYLWTDQTLRFIFLLMMGINFLLIGPIMVGIPVLANYRLPEGATAFGLLMSSFAGGSLTGYIVSGALPRPSAARIRWVMVGLFASFGVVIGALGYIPFTWLDCALLFALGLGNGYVAVMIITWIQTRTPKEMLGRMMSLLMLCSTGLMPISQAVAGVLSKWNLTLLFVLPGALVVLMTAWIVFQPELKSFSASLTAAQVPAQEQ